MEIRFGPTTRNFPFSTHRHRHGSYSPPSSCYSELLYPDVAVASTDRKCRSGAGRTRSPSFDSYCVAVEAFFDEKPHPLSSQNALAWAGLLIFLICLLLLSLFTNWWLLVKDSYCLMEMGVVTVMSLVFMKLIMWKNVWKIDMFGYCFNFVFVIYYHV